MRRESTAWLHFWTSPRCWKGRNAGRGCSDFLAQGPGGSSHSGFSVVLEKRLLHDEYTLIPIYDIHDLQSGWVATMDEVQ